MPQLVGKKCAVCDERISSVLEGEFCNACSNPVHLKCKKTTDSALSPQTCLTCGSSRLLTTTSGGQRNESSQPPPFNLERFKQLRMSLTLLFCGVMLIPAGVVFVAHPELWSIPHQRSFRDIAFGVGLTGGGFVLCIMGVWWLKRTP